MAIFLYVLCIDSIYMYYVDILCILCIYTYGSASRYYYIVHQYVWLSIRKATRQSGEVQRCIVCLSIAVYIMVRLLSTSHLGYSAGGRSYGRYDAPQRKKTRGLGE